MSADATRYDATRYNTVVVGSGAAGLLAACIAADNGHRVLVLEATDVLGGTSAWSGGQLWLPGSAAMTRAGHADTPERARSYLDRTVLGATPADQLDAFIAEAPLLADYLEADLDLPLFSVDRPDYHPDWPGSATGRTLEPLPVPTEELGDWASRLRVSSTRRPLTGVESRAGLAEEIITERERAGIRTQGAGLVAGLVRGALRRGLEIRTDARVTDLVREGPQWTVTTADGQPVLCSNVVLAAGGFAQNAAMRHDHLPLIDIVATAAPRSEGDGLQLGVRAGGHLKNMHEAWWTAAVRIPGSTPEDQPTHRNVVRELAFPGSMIVNAAGRRFVDEASSYNDLGKAFFAFDAAQHTFPNAQAWLVFDHHFKTTRTVAGIGPDQAAPEWFCSADTLAVLATRLGIDAAGLQDSAHRMALAAETGVDPDFGRGANTHDRFNGDDTHVPNACLGGLNTPPFHAVPITLGANGTKGGLATDPWARALDLNDRPIPGLFAVGETAAALMGPGYAGSGASLGPALVAAWSLRHALPEPVQPQPVQR